MSVDTPVRALVLATVLNLVFVLVEVIAGVWTGSLSLLADAAHNLGDVLGLALALVTALLARRVPSGRRTFGWRKSTILAALANALAVFVAVGIISYEAIHRLLSPEPVGALTVALVAGIGVVINGGSVWLLHRKDERDINLRAATAHLVADTLVSVGVIIAALAIWLTDWQLIDPLVGLAIGAVIAVTTWRVLVDALDLSMDAAPRHLDVSEVEQFLLASADVVEVHDLHVWALGSDDVAAMAHVVFPAGYPDATRRVCEMAAALEEAFGIAHTTLQAECPDTALLCPLRAPGTL